MDWYKNYKISFIFYYYQQMPTNKASGKSLLTSDVCLAQVWGQSIYLLLYLFHWSVLSLADVVSCTGDQQPIKAS